ncbi:MAG: CHAP domain-containing protein, partial [Actinobacteria bacterium]|nr:CHAP domain-containing protein [Actinomycetota bacterium]
MLTRLVADEQGRVGWEWLILPSSPSGNWRITVYCKLGGRHAHATTTVLVVTASRKRGGPIGDPTSVHPKFGQSAGEGGGVCGPFEPGQCTCLAYQKRPDVYNTAVARGVPAGGTRAAGPGFYVWDGEQWLVNAQRGGIPTGSQPVAGALVVWGIPNSAAYGHVAYVEAATSPTHVLVAECNYDFQGHCRTIWENPQAAPHLQGYVYGGPAGNGPAGGAPSTPGGAGPGEPPGGVPNGSNQGPSIAINPSNGLATAVAEGPSNSLYAYWQEPGGA